MLSSVTSQNGLSPILVEKLMEPLIGLQKLRLTNLLILSGGILTPRLFTALYLLSKAISVDLLNEKVPIQPKKKSTMASQKILLFVSSSFVFLKEMSSLYRK